MSLYISEQIQWDESNQNTRKFGGGVEIGGSIEVTGSIYALPPTLGLSADNLNSSVTVLSGSGPTGSNGLSDGNYIPDYTGFQLQTIYTASLAMARPTSAQLSVMLPNATTGSLYMVGSGSESWLVFKDIKGTWRTMTASLAG